MKKWKKKILSLALLMSAAAAFFAIPARAETRKKISSVKLKIESHIKPGDKIGEEEIEIDLGSDRYSFDRYEVMNDTFEWFEEDIPEIRIYLDASDGYYFYLKKASSVYLTGATYIKATKENDSETLILEVKLPSLQEQVADLEEVTLTSGGYVYWDAPVGAGSYNLRVYRNGKMIGTTEILTTETEYNLQKSMEHSGSYQVRVCPRNKINSDVRGAWTDSNMVTLSEDDAKQIREGKVEDRPKSGKWMYDNVGGWWYMFSDGTYPKDEWQEIKDEWYFFGEKGYMETGWITWNGKEYYCDDKTGEMLRNTMTPDGYILDENGNKKNGR